MVVGESCSCLEQDKHSKRQIRACDTDEKDKKIGLHK